MNLFKTEDERIRINLDKVELIEVERKGVISIYFISTYIQNLEGEDAKAFLKQWDEYQNGGRR